MGLCYLGHAQEVIFDFDTGTPVLTPRQNIPINQVEGGILAHFSAITGAYSIQTSTTTGFELSQFSGKFLYPNTTRGSSLRIQFGDELTDISFTFATTDYSPTQPTPVLLTAFQVSASGTNQVGSVSGRAAYGNPNDSYPMGTLSFNSGSKVFNRVEIKIQGDSTFFADNVAVIPVPQLDIRLGATNTVVISWPAPSTGFVLQEKSSVASTNWVGVSQAVEVVGGTHQVIISEAVDAGFFRLYHP